MSGFSIVEIDAIVPSYCYWVRILLNFCRFYEKKCDEPRNFGRFTDGAKDALRLPEHFRKKWKRNGDWLFSIPIGRILSINGHCMFSYDH
jgi:hypothetical protein